MWPGMPASQQTNIDTDKILKEVCHYYDLNPILLGEPIRWRKVVRARHVSWHLMRLYVPGITLNEMGRLLLKDHTTVMHGLKSISNDMETDPRVLREVEAIALRIKNT